MIAVVKDLLIYGTVLAALIIIPAELGGYGHIFASVAPKKLLLAAPPLGSLGAQSAYATLALGSALALFLYPHAVTGVLSSSSRHVIRRNAIAMPAYSLALGLIALMGYMAHRCRREGYAAISPTASKRSAQLRGARAVPARVSVLVRGRGLCRHRHRRAGARRHHVDRVRPICSPASSTGNISIRAAAMRRKAGWPRSSPWSSRWAR